MTTTHHRTIALVIAWLVLAASTTLAVADLIMGNPWAEMAAPDALSAWLRVLVVACPWVLMVVAAVELISIRRTPRTPPAPTSPVPPLWTWELAALERAWREQRLLESGGDHDE